jgi:hypothetical protein
MRFHSDDLGEIRTWQIFNGMIRWLAVDSNETFYRSFKFLFLEPNIAGIEGAISLGIIIWKIEVEIVFTLH